MFLFLIEYSSYLSNIFSKIGNYITYTQKKTIRTQHTIHRRLYCHVPIRSSNDHTSALGFDCKFVVRAKIVVISYLQQVMHIHHWADYQSHAIYVAVCS